MCNTALILLLWVKVPFLPQNVDFLQKMSTSAKLKGSWYYIYWYDIIFPETIYVCVLT